MNAQKFGATDFVAYMKTMCVSMVLMTIISGCQKHDVPKKTSHIVVTPSGKAEIPDAAVTLLKIAVTKRLKDPNSAVFEDEHYYVDQIDLDGKMYPGAYKLCGLVNAKNSYGGYSGSSPFLAVIDFDENWNVKDTTVEIFETNESDSSYDFLKKSFDEFKSKLCLSMVTKA